MQPLSERSGAVGYQENDTDGHAISKITEDLRDVIIEYQVSPGSPAAHWMFYSGVAQFAQQKSLYEQNRRLIVRPGFFFSKMDQILTTYFRQQVSCTSTLADVH